MVLSQVNDVAICKLLEHKEGLCLFSEIVIDLVVICATTAGIELSLRNMPSHVYEVNFFGIQDDDEQQ
jgi:hypothetical protein